MDRLQARPGDLLFYRVNPKSNLFHNIIGFLQRISGNGPGKYYHVSILDGTLEYQYEATPPKTRRSKVDWNNPDIEIWRIVDANDDQLFEMVQAARLTVGEWYGIGKSISCLLRSKRLLVCTQYIVDAAFFGNIDLQEDDKDPILSPDEMSEHPSIYQVAS